MKSLTIIILFCFAATSVMAQKTVTCTFEVSGNCDMCKETIEAAALIKGVKLAVWDKSTSVLKVIFRPDKTDSTSIQKAVAKAGYDTPEFTAEEVDYDALPACCAYRDSSKAKH